MMKYREGKALLKGYTVKLNSCLLFVDNTYAMANMKWQ